MSTQRRGATRATAGVAVGVLVSGVATYVFLVLVARMLGPQGYAPFAVGWSVALVIGTGLFAPLEQETARRTAHAAAVGGPDAPDVAVMGWVACVMALAGAGLLGLGGLVPSPPLQPGTGTWWALLAVTAAYAVQMPVRGALSGEQRYTAYGAVLGVEGVSRALAAGVLVVVGAGSPTACLLMVAGGAVVSVLGPLLRRSRRRVRRPATAELRRAIQAVALLSFGAVAAQALINVGPVLVTALAGPTEQGEASRLLAGMSLVRVPLFLFTAVQATLIPRLTAAGALGDLARFRRELAQLLAVVAAVTVAAVVVSLLVGEAVVRLLFGDGFQLPGVDLAILAAGVGAYLAAMSAAAALVALDRHVAVLRGWTAGLAVLAVTTALVDGLLLRVELGFAFGAVAAAAWLTAELLRVRRRMRAGAAT